MDSSHKFITGLVIGAAAGAALALFLKSEKGRQLLSDISEGSDKMQNDLTIKMQEFDEMVSDFCKKGISLIDEWEQRIEQKAS